MMNYEWSIIKIGNGRKRDSGRIIETVKLKIEKIYSPEFRGIYVIRFIIDRLQSTTESSVKNRFKEYWLYSMVPKIIDL